MSNSLTGDFEAVLQVSGRTLDRLMASIHQNDSATSNLPKFPHSLSLRIGDDRPVDGVRGSVQVQLGAPRIELVHGASDRFVLEVSVRARFKPDPRSEKLPNFIHGTVRAEYQLKSIDPRCFGWAGVAEKHLWVRVIRDSVRFQGSAEEDVASFEQSISLEPPASAVHAANEAKITRQIAALLATRFAAKPHPVSTSFRPGRLRSLRPPAGDTAVVIPVGLGGDPVGALESVANVILDGSDFALGVTRNYLLSLAAPTLAAIAGFKTTIPVYVSLPWPVPDVSTVYRVAVNPPSVEWHAHEGFAIIKIKIKGTATTDSVAPNASFDVEQDIVVNFDAGAGGFRLATGSRSVTASATGIGNGVVAEVVKKAVNAAVSTFVDAACIQMQPSLDALVAQKQRLVEQLKSIDEQADASVDQASFLADGVVVRGAVTLARRRAPVAAYDKTAEQDGFTALESWLPGGRIEKLEWSWTWTGEGEPGAANHHDRFLLRRPPAKVGRWGKGLATALREQLPGIDGNGTVCLKIRGVQLDAVTGEFVRVESVRRCQRFGAKLSISATVDKGRLFLHDAPEAARDVPFPELALLAVEAAPRARATNTLLLYLQRRFDEETAATLRGALEMTRRTDAGLALLVLFKEGLLESTGGRLASEVREFGESVGVTTFVDEDVRGSWSRGFALDAPEGDVAWRLLSPGGGVTWMHRGRLKAKRLAAALDQCLLPSPSPTPVRTRVGLELGMRVSESALERLDSGALDSDCPPTQLGRVGLRATVLSFVQRSSSASEARLRKLTTDHGQREDGPLVIVVVDGASARETAQMRNALGFDFATLADRDGVITDRFGVHVWPTTITLDPHGIVSAVEIGERVPPYERGCEHD